MFKRIDINNIGAVALDDTPHPEKQNVNTTVSEYLRKYGQGKIDSLPTDSRPEVSDPRTVDEMLDDSTSEIGLGTEELDVLVELQQNAERFNNAILDVEASSKEKTKFENAMQVINDPNSSYEAKMDAYRLLDELEKKGKVSYS